VSRIYQTAIAIGATISKAFGSDVRNAAESIKKLSEATKQLKGAEKSAAAFKKLDDEVTRSKRRYDTASEALRRLDAAERAAGGATKESTKWRKAGERAVAASARQFDRASAAAQKNAEALHKLGVDTSKLASEQDRLTRALAATERQEKSLEHYEHARERLFGKKKEKTPLFEKAGEQFKSVGETVLHLTEGALVAGEAMHLLVEKTMHAGAEVGESAEKLGIGARALQELRYGARQTGAEVEDLDRALGKMAINIGKHKIAKGKGGGGAAAIPGLQMLGLGGKGDGAAAADPFKQIGLKAKDLAGLKPEEQLKKIAEGMLKLKTHAEKAAIAQEIFGKGATAILPFLAEGAEGIEKLSKSANKYGGVLSDESVAAAVEAEKASKDMNLALGGLANTLGAVLLPTAVKAFKGIAKWVGENRGQIKKWGEGAAKWIEDKGIPAFKHIAAEVQTFGGKVLWLVNGAAKLTGGFGNLAIVVAGLRLAPLAVTLGKIGIEGTKAAIAIFKYVAAKKAAAALGGGLDGMGPGGGTGGASGIGVNVSGWILRGLGLSVGGFALLAAPVAISAAALIYAQSKKDALVDKLVEGTDEYNKNIENDPEFRKGERDKFYSKVKGITRRSGGMVTGDEAAAAGLPAMPRTGGRGGSVHVAPVIHIHGNATRDEVANGMDAAKAKALEDFDKREAHRKRVSFGH
jgi:hypothetical protein